MKEEEVHNCREARRSDRRKNINYQQRSGIKHYFHTFTTQSFLSHVNGKIKKDKELTLLSDTWNGDYEREENHKTDQINEYEADKIKGIDSNSQETEKGHLSTGRYLMSTSTKATFHLTKADNPTTKQQLKTDVSTYLLLQHAEPLEVKSSFH